MTIHLESGTRPGGPGPRQGTAGSHRRPLASLLAGVLVLIAAFGPAPQAKAQGESGASVMAAVAVSPGPAHHPREKTFMKRQWGVEVLYVRQTAAGYMLEFRYKVLDAEKAKALFERQTKPLLTHAETGARLIVPTPAKTGALRNSNPPLDGHTYWMFFANPGRLVQPGDHVSIDIGEFRVAGLVVQ
jgi:F0F1-type ATP synthase membrane subunit c/vacuolar-type H+-ATPase subunit K